MAEGQTSAPSAQGNRSSVIGTDNVGSGESAVADSFGAEQDSSDALSGITEQDVPFLSDEALDAALENEPGEEREVSGEEDDSSNETDSDSSGEDDSKQATDSKADDSRDDAEGGKEMTKEELREALRRETELNASKERFIQKRNQEYGDLKKHFSTEIDKLRADMQEMTPAEAAEASGKLNELKNELENVKRHETVFNGAIECQKVVFDIIPQHEFTQELVNEMGEQIREAGGDEQYIANFVKNPFAIAKAHEIIMLNQVTKKDKMMRLFATAYKKQKEINESLKKKPAELLRKVDQVSKNSRGVTGKSAGGTSQKEMMASLTEADIANLSDSELDRMYQASKRSGR